MFKTTLKPQISRFSSKFFINFCVSINKNINIIPFRSWDRASCRDDNDYNQSVQVKIPRNPSGACGTRCCRYYKSTSSDVFRTNNHHKSNHSYEVKVDTLPSVYDDANDAVHVADSDCGDIDLQCQGDYCAANTIIGFFSLYNITITGKKIWLVIEV